MGNSKRISCPKFTSSVSHKPTRIISFILVLILFSTVYSQGLSSNAAQIKSSFPDSYNSIFKKYAVEKWGTDHEMILYQINNQADALFALINNFDSSYSSILIEAILKWNLPGYESKNAKTLETISSANLESLIKLGCDWEMVKYEYDNQVEASKTLSSEKPEGYNEQAVFLFENFQSIFDTTIKAPAKNKWGNDLEMVVYEINNQSEALLNLIDKYEDANYEILLSALKKWQIKEFENQNALALDELSTIEVSQLIPLYCDWTMVEYEYDNQVKAKNSY